MPSVPTKVQLTIKGADNTGKAFNSVAKRADGLGKKLKGALKVAAIAAAVASIGKTIKAALDDMNKLHDIAQQAGTSAEWLNRFSGAMAQAGIVTDVNGLVASMQKLNKSITDPEKLKAFEKLGYDIRQLEGLAPEEAFVRFMETVSEVKDESRRLLLLQRGMEEQGLKLAPLMRLGPEAFKKSLADVMAMIPSAQESVINLATNANNALALAALDAKAHWHNFLGALMLWAQETFERIDLLIMRVWRSVLLVGQNIIAAIITPLWKLAEQVALLFVNLNDGLKLFLMRIVQLFQGVYKFMVQIAAGITSLFNEEAAGRLFNYAADIGSEAEYYISELLRKNGVEEKDSLYESMKKNLDEYRDAMRRYEKGFKAKDLLTSMQPLTAKELAGLNTKASEAVTDVRDKDAKSLTSKIAGAVKSGTEKGLTAGIDASSYDAIKAVFTAASKDALNAAARARPVAATVAAAVGGTSASGMTGGRTSAGRVEQLLAQLLQVVRGGVGTLEKLEAF